MLTRFAPSPTGHLHLGHVLAAKEAFSAARKMSGRCLLRIEDIDHTRCRPEFTQAIFDDLSWLGLAWPEPVRIQSQHKTDYNGVIEVLRTRGLLYRCFKSRKEIPPDFYRGQPLSADEEGLRLGRKDPFAGGLPCFGLGVRTCVQPGELLGQAFSQS